MKKKLLYVYAPSGPPIDYALPIIADRASIYTLIAVPSNAYNLSIIEKYAQAIVTVDEFCREDVAEAIYGAAKRFDVDAIVTFSEYLLESVCHAARRLDLKNAGPNVRLARDKIEMRRAWLAADVPQPQFMEVHNAQDVVEACRQIGLPLLIKVADGAGSIGQQIVDSINGIDVKLANLQGAVLQARDLGKSDPANRLPMPRIIAEQIIRSSTGSWYDETSWGDYLSVEGIVRSGVYHPLAITARLPTIPPFIEVSNIAPCPLSLEKKLRILGSASHAVDALELEDCATHTELKLLGDGTVQLLETAARMGGVAIAKELKHVFGIDLVDLLVCTLLDEPCRIPGFEETAPTGAAASLSLMGANAAGTPWLTKRIFDPVRVDWRALAGRDVTVNVEPCQSIVPGQPVPTVFSAGGTLTNAGIAFVTAPDLKHLTHALSRILEGLETHFPLQAQSHG